jgi:hypothetical protein
MKKHGDERFCGECHEKVIKEELEIETYTFFHVCEALVINNSVVCLTKTLR